MHKQKSDQEKQFTKKFLFIYSCSVKKFLFFKLLILYWTTVD